MAVPHGRVPLRYTPGRWVAVTSASGGAAADAPQALVLLADLDAASPTVTACWDAVEAGSGFDAVLGVILREGLRSVPSFAIAARSPDGVRVLVSGKARAEVCGADGAPVVLDAAAAPTWLERTLPGATSARLLVPGVDPGPMLALHGGVVLAAAVELGHAVAAVSATADTRTERPPPPPQPAPVAAPAPAPAAAPAAAPAPAAAEPAPAPGDPGLIDSLPWLVKQSSPEPAGELAAAVIPPVAAPRPAPSGPVTGGARTGPIVLAVTCPNRHLGPPYAGICRVCGAQVPHQDPFSVPRPVLGVLNISTGAMVPLDRDVVLGRAPTAGATDSQNRPHLVQLASPGNDISRNHVRIGLEGWHVLVTDLGSTNGTVVTLPGQQPVRLRAHDAFTVVPGTVVNIADEDDVRFEIQS